MLSEQQYVEQLHRYLTAVFGASSYYLRPIPPSPTLPYFLLDAFQLLELTLFGQQVTLALETRESRPPAAELKRQLQSLTQLMGRPSVYAVESLASYERRHLIEQSIAFIVPGNQLFLPPLGLDLREHFRKSVSAPAVHFAPASQALLIRALLEPAWRPTSNLADLASPGEYTAMTVSRAAREIAASGIARISQARTSNVLEFAAGPRETWEQAQPLLRPPHRRTVYVRADVPKHWPLAGESALAALTLLSDPAAPVFAQRMLPVTTPPTFEVLAHRETDTVDVQLWFYLPDWQHAQVVDPLSLLLSFRGATDDRVREALEEVEKKLPW